MNACLEAVASPSEPVELIRPVYLSHSSSNLYEVCPHQYEARYVERLDATAKSVNLGYGSAFDEAVSAFIVAHALGQDGQLDPVAIFEESFDKFAAGGTVAYSTKFDARDTCVASGKRLVERFIEAWRRWGYTAAIDMAGKPIVQRELRVQLASRVVYTAIIDTVLVTPDGRVVVADVKSASAPSSDAFRELSGQLTGQQMVVEAHKEELGIDHVDGLTFLEAIKKTIPKGKGTGPEVLDPVIVESHAAAEIQAYIQSRLWIAEDIRRKRFPKRPLMSYNTPCDMCDYALYCRKNDRTGLRVRPKHGS